MDAFKEVPIIAMSASVSATDSRQSLEAGMNAFLPKPVNADSLLNRIAALLRLEWIHSPATTESATPPAALGPLVAPPAEEMDVLHRLAQRGNMQDIVAHADYLTQRDERYRPFANQLKSLAKDYQSQAILHLVEQCLNGDGASNRHG